MASPVLADPDDDDGDDDAEDDDEEVLGADGDEDPDGSGVGLDLHPKRNADRQNAIKSNVTILFILNSSIVFKFYMNRRYPLHTKYL